MVDNSIDKSLRKRKYIYANNPARYEIRCDKCNGENIWWSEYESHIWCYDCEIDTSGTEGIFGGPICFNAMRLVGLTFDRINLETEQLEICKIEDNELKWVERKLLASS